ncbi:MAG: DUF2063 domain-containing protein [Gemmobacter sp.]
MNDAFAAALLDPARTVPDGLTDPKGRPAGRRFAVYRNNVIVSLTEALETGFPVVRALVGAEFFRAMAGEFLRMHPPKGPVLSDYGDDLPAFLAWFPPVAKLSYLPDMARLELAMRTSYHAADARPISVADVAALAPARLAGARLRFAPPVRLVRSAWPIHGIWTANTLNGPPPAAGAEDVLILRSAFDPVPRLLPPGGGDFVAALLAGRTLAEAALAAGERHDLNGTIGLLMANAAIIDIQESTI